MSVVINNLKEEQSRFKLIAQNRHDNLIIEVVGENIFLVKTAWEVISSPDLLHGLPREDLVIIAVAAGMAIAES